MLTNMNVILEFRTGDDGYEHSEREHRVLGLELRRL